MKAIKYALWAATLVVAGWAISLASAVVAGKGGIQRQSFMETEAGLVDQ